MNKIIVGIAVIISSLTLLACKKQAIVSSQPVDLNRQLLSSFHPDEVDFTYMALKSKVDYSDENGDVQVSVITRSKKDSLLWFSIGKSSIEGVRAIVRPDSIFVLDRMNNEYFNYNLKYIQEFIQAGLNYYNLQNLLVGNLTCSLSLSDQLKKEESIGYYILNQKRDSLYIESFVRMDNMKLEKANFIDSSTMSRMSIAYSNFIMTDSMLVPSNCLIDIAYTKQNKKYDKKILLTHHKIEFPAKSLNFPFNVPKKYEGK
jgi:hypothetical protein